MKLGTNICNTILVIAMLAVSTFSAKLEISQKVGSQLEKIKNKKVSQSINLSNSKILESDEAVDRPVVLEVVQAKEDQQVTNQLSKQVTKPEQIIFNKKRGSYLYSDIDLQKVPLIGTDTTALNDLKKTAKNMVVKLLGEEQASHFVFANEETDSVIVKGKASSYISKKTYRFTRKVNGRHILDNTAFIRVLFSGKQELSGFEIVNPELKIVRAVDRLVKLSSTQKRLEEYANNKRTTLRNGPDKVEEIEVEAINAINGIDTYLSKKIGDKVLLLPNISFYSEYKLKNGEKFDNWSHFCLDADYVQNLDKDMIEDTVR
jgi:hypothetical protein